MRAFCVFAAALIGVSGLTCIAPAPSFGDQFTLRATHHWDHMPVRVFFTASATATPERIAAAEAGFYEWTTASDGVLRHSLVDRAQDADVVVELDAAASIMGDAQRVGETLVDMRGAVLKRARIRLATGNTDNSQLTEEAAHEWGHALGIAAHSRNPNDLMYPNTVRVYDIQTGEYEPTPPRIVSTEDIQAVEAGYPALFRAAQKRP